MAKIFRKWKNNYTTNLLILFQHLECKFISPKLWSCFLELHLICESSIEASQENGSKSFFATTVLLITLEIYLCYIEIILVCVDRIHLSSYKILVFNHPNVTLNIWDRVNKGSADWESVFWTRPILYSTMWREWLRNYDLDWKTTKVATYQIAASIV